MTSNVAGVACRLCFVLIAALTLLMASADRPARADCVQSGTVVTCSGASPGGFNAGAQNALTVNVLPGAAVGTGLSLNNNNLVSNLGSITIGISGNGISAGTGNTITSAGSISGGDGGTGVFANSGTSVNHSGTITVGDGGAGIVINGSGTVVNSGTIQTGGLGTGIQGSNITNAASGTIIVGDGAFAALYSTSAGATIVNNGSIAAGIDSQIILSTGGLASIVNTGTITYAGCGFGISAGGAGNNIVNSGTIRDTGCGGNGIVADTSNVVSNTGTIIVGDSGIGIVGANLNTITNSGRIEAGNIGVGLYANSRSILRNSGTISVGDSLSISGGMLGDGSGMQLINTGTIVGGFGTPAMIVRGRNSTLSNSGTITVGSFGGGLIGQDRDNNYVNSGTINVGFSGLGIDAQGNVSTVNNTGTINGGINSVGIQVRNSTTVVNSGTIAVGANGIGISGNDATTVTSSGTITAGVNGVGIRSGGNIVNSGRITVGSSLTFGSAGMLGSGTGLQLTNSGTITGGAFTPAMIVLGGNASLLNTGTLTVGTGGGGLVVQGGNARLNNSGVINAGAGGLGLSALGSNATLLNSGTITVGGNGVGMAINDASSNALFNNSGTINAIGSGGVGISAMGANSTVVNSGTINANATGISTGSSHFVLNTGAITVGASAVGISGSAASAVTNSGAITAGPGGTGIALSGNGTSATNSGTITTCGVGISSAGTGSSVVNSGTITAGSGCGATGVMLGLANSLTNAGTIAGSVTLAMGAGGGNATVLNSGTLNGVVALFGTGGNSLTNSGTLTVTAPYTTGGGVAHVVDGTYTQTASGVFVTRMSTNNAAGNYDTLGVRSTVAGTGVANLGGTVRLALQPGLYGLSTTYAGVLTFSSSTGRFSVVTEPYLFLNAAAVYNPTSVDIVVTRSPFPQIPGGGGNAQAVASVLEANYSPSLTGAAATFYMQLLQSTAPNTLSQLTGEVATAPQNASFTVFGQFLGTVFGQVASSRTLGGSGSQTAQQTAIANGARLALAGPDACIGDSCDSAGQPVNRRYTAWAQGFGGAGSIDSNATAGSSRVDMNAGGGALGMDVRLDGNALVGFALGTASSAYSLTDIMSSGSSRSIVFGLYGGYTMGPAYIDATLAYSYNTYTSNRFIGTGSISEVENASFSGSQYGGRVEGGWRFGFDRNVLTPFAGLTVQALSTPGYTETSTNVLVGGPGMLGVSLQAQTTTSVRSTIGAQFETAITAGDDAVFRPRVRLGWLHEFNTNRTATATLSSVLPFAPFQVTGAQAAADALVVGAGFELELTRMVRLYGQFDGEFASNARAFAGTGGLRLVW